MAMTEEERKFTDEESNRFAALLAGVDIGNSSDAEAKGKLQALRRMAAEKNVRIVDALELDEIREAVDRQLQPARAVQIVTEERVIYEGCHCDPWPAQMFWFLVGVTAWIVTGFFWMIRQVWKLIVLMLILVVVREIWRKACRNG
jgi:hypothetical protein